MRLVSLIIGLVIIVFASQAAAFWGLFGNSAKDVAAVDGNIVIDVSALPQDGARFYRHRVDGLVIKFFVVRDGEGAIRAALDACEVCWKAGKGYELADGAMRCVNCGRRFPLARIGIVSGGCNPHPFRFKTEGDSVIIEARELMLGADYFPENVPENDK